MAGSTPCYSTLRQLFAARRQQLTDADDHQAEKGPEEPAQEGLARRDAHGAGAGGRGQFRTPSGRAALAATGPAPSGAPPPREGI